MKKIFKVLFVSLFVVCSYNLILAEETEIVENTNETTIEQTNNQEQESKESNKQTIEETNQEEIKEEIKETTLTDYNNILKEFFEAYNGNDGANKTIEIDKLNACFENLCKNIKPELLEIVKEKHKTIVDNLKEKEINISNLNSNLYKFSYIVTQNKEDLAYTYIPLKNISLAGYTLGEQFKNKGEHIPNISNVEFLTQDDNENIHGKYLILPNDKEIYWIFLKLEGNLRNKIIEYVNNSLSKYNNKKLFTTRIQGWDFFLEKDTTTTYYKGFVSKKRLKTDNHYGIEKNNLKIDIDNIYPVYSYPFANRNEHYGFKGTELRFVDKFENIDEYKKPLVDFLNKYKIGKKINVTNETKYLGEQIINGTKMHKFKISESFEQLIYAQAEQKDKNHYTREYEKEYQIIEKHCDFYIYTDLQAKIIKIFEAVFFHNNEDINYKSMIYDNAVLDVYGIKTYYTDKMVGQKITTKNNKTTKITRIGYSDLNLFNNGSEIQGKRIQDDIITSFSKLEIKENREMR